jgi:hypothetical protein
MTQAFETFMKQHKSTGSQKADGYSSDAFEGLNDREKAIVFDLLASELPWYGAVKWIFTLDPKQALTISKELEKRLRGDPYGDAYMIQPSLLQYSGDMIYQKHLIEDYSNYVDDKKPYVVDAVDKTPINAASVDFFKRVILTEVNSSAVARASRYFLNSMNVPNKTEADRKYYIRLLDDLRSDSTATKLRAIAQVEIQK